MKFLKHKQHYEDNLERLLDNLSELTRGLGKKEFNALIDALKSMYDVRQKLKTVKTDEEKEVQPVNDSEKYLEQEIKK